MDKIDIHKIDNFFDVIDSAIMILSNRCDKDYLNSFVEFSEYLLFSDLDTRLLEQEDIESLEKAKADLLKMEINSEEVRQANLLAIIKGYKHNNMSLDSITPESICMIFAIVINAFEEKYRDKMSVMDVNAGCGNLLSSVANNIRKDVDLIAIEKDELLAKVLAASCNMQDLVVDIYCNDCLDSNMGANLIISDLDGSEFSKDKPYLPFEVIKKYYDKTDYMILLIDNEFFLHPNIKKFKKDFKGTLLGLITLPANMFVDKQKSILIVGKEQKSYDMMVMRLPSITERNLIQERISKIKTWIESI